MKEHVEAVAHETKEVKPQDLFERSSTVSYLNTMKRFKQGCAGAKDMNRLNEEKRRTKSSQTHASRNDQVSSQLLYRQAQCISRRVASVWIPRFFLHVFKLFYHFPIKTDLADLLAYVDHTATLYLKQLAMSM